MKSPLVSVVAGVYNGGKYLRSSLASVLSQEGVDFELIVVNDGSTDESPMILADMARTDSRLRVFHQENQGLTRALIRGCSEANGCLIARHDVDDLSLPGRLAKQAALLTADLTLNMVSCWSKVLGPEDEGLYEIVRPTAKDDATALLLKSREGPCHGSVMFRFDAYRRVGGYRTVFRYAQDWDLWLRLVEFGSIAYVGEFLYAFRVTETSISARQSDTQKKLLECALECRAARLRGAAETPSLDRAQLLLTVSTSDLRKEGGPNANYFIGKCLLDRGDPRARKYLQRSLKQNPWQPRAWAALLAVPLLCDN